jgi:nicotinamide-nucleotide amidase
MAEALDGAVPEHVDELARRILEEAGRRRLKLATAESCTGGLLASLLTDLPGRSHVFERGFVTYSNDAKREMLGVPQTLLDGPGPVSEEVARAMAQGALERSRADLACAVTGYAEAPPGEPAHAGLVHFALARRGGTVRHRCEAFGPIGRAEVRRRSLGAALEMMWQAIGGG